MKKLISALLLLALSMPLALRAVTPEELEQARTYAAIIYLRNANNGSDYLDAVNVGSRKALEGKLRNDKDRANLKLFNSKLPSASGSESWTRDELVEYARKAVKAPGNYSSTGYAANQVSKRIRSMQLSAPKPKTETTKPQENPEPDPQPQQPAPDTVQTANVPEPFAEAEAQPMSANPDSALIAAEDSLLAEMPQTEQGTSSSNTTLYIIILVVLVIAVVVLVVYAVRYINRQGNAADRKEPADRDSKDTRREADSAAEQIRERDRIIESLRAENTELRRAIEEYKYHINYLRAEQQQQPVAKPAAAATLNDTFANRRSEAAPAARETVAAPRPAPEKPAPAPAPAAEKNVNPNGTQRTIYLGRANREGMFIRAERNLNPQHSLFRLQTSDNLTGSYIIADDPEVEQRILANPDLMLAVSCRAEDSDTYGKEAVATIEAGKAIFENGRWRVLRPARVRFV